MVQSQQLIEMWAEVRDSSNLSPAAGLTISIMVVQWPSVVANIGLNIRRLDILLRWQLIESCYAPNTSSGPAILK